jgi:hypothetical protein
MKKYFLFVFLLLSTYSFSQSIEYLVTNATLQQDYSSVIDFGKESKVTKRQLENWIQSNTVSSADWSSSKVMKGFIKTEYISRFTYGANHVYASKFIFVKASQFNAYSAYWEKQAELARERKEQENLVGVGTAILGGYILYKGGKAILQGVGKMLDTDVKSDTRRNDPTSPFYDLISKSENLSFRVSKYDIPSKEVNISIGCNYYKHQLDKKSDGFYASFTSNDYNNTKVECFTDYNVLGKNEISNGQAPGVLYVTYVTRDSKTAIISMLIKEPGYYRVEIEVK